MSNAERGIKKEVRIFTRFSISREKITTEMKEVEETGVRRGECGQGKGKGGEDATETINSYLRNLVCEGKERNLRKLRGAGGKAKVGGRLFLKMKDTCEHSNEKNLVEML